MFAMLEADEGSARDGPYNAELANAGSHVEHSGLAPVDGDELGDASRHGYGRPE